MYRAGSSAAASRRFRLSCLVLCTRSPLASLDKRVRGLHEGRTLISQQRPEFFECCRPSVKHLNAGPATNSNLRAGAMLEAGPSELRSEAVCRRAACGSGSGSRRRVPVAGSAQATSCAGRNEGPAALRSRVRLRSHREAQIQHLAQGQEGSAGPAQSRPRSISP